MIIQPRGTNEIIRVIEAIQSSKFKIAVRGGGLSYSAGYLAERENTVLLDMRLCDQIIQINADDMFGLDSLPSLHTTIFFRSNSFSYF